jgi:hypothetical protein
MLLFAFLGQLLGFEAIYYSLGIQRRLHARLVFGPSSENL